LVSATYDIQFNGEVLGNCGNPSRIKKHPVINLRPNYFASIKNLTPALILLLYKAGITVRFLSMYDCETLINNDSVQEKREGFYEHENEPFKHFFPIRCNSAYG
jgi:hypothetical protein